MTLLLLNNLLDDGQTQDENKIWKDIVQKPFNHSHLSFGSIPFIHTFNKNKKTRSTKNILDLPHSNSAYKKRTPSSPFSWNPILKTVSHSLPSCIYYNLCVCVCFDSLVQYNFQKHSWKYLYVISPVAVQFVFIIISNNDTLCWFPNIGLVWLMTLN